MLKRIELSRRLCARYEWDALLPTVAALSKAGWREAKMLPTAPL